MSIWSLTIVSLIGKTATTYLIVSLISISVIDLRKLFGIIGFLIHGEHAGKEKVRVGLQYTLDKFSRVW